MPPLLAAPPNSASSHFRVMQRLTLLATEGAKRRRTNLRQLALFVQAMQILAARAGVQAVRAIAEEQGIAPVMVGAVAAQAFGGNTPNAAPLTALLGQVTAPDAPIESLGRLVWTLIADAGRDAQAVATVATPTLEGHVRYVNLPACARCVILAGQFYKWSDGFLRHPQCDCVMVPTSETPPDGFVSDPMEAFRRGGIRGLSKADTEAILAGADIGRVVNVRRKSAGLSKAGRVLTRTTAGSRRRAGVESLTPEGVFELASDRADALELLRRYGYIT